LAIQAFVGTFGAGQYGGMVSSYGVASLIVSVLAALLGRKALVDSRETASWEGQVARAAILLGALGVVFGVVTILGGLVGS
jgi:hypothetical protein